MYRGTNVKREQCKTRFLSFSNDKCGLDGGECSRYGVSVSSSTSSSRGLMMASRMSGHTDSLTGALNKQGRKQGGAGGGLKQRAFPF